MTSKPNWMHKFLARYAKDAPEDDVAEVLAEILEESVPAPAPAQENVLPDEENAPEAENAARHEGDECAADPDAEKAEDDETAENTLSEKLDRVLAALETILAACTGRDEAGEPEEQQDGDPAEEPEDDADWIYDEPEAEEPETDEDPAELIEARDMALRAALRAVKPALDALDPRTRRAVTERIRRNVYAGDAKQENGNGSGGYAALKRAADRARPDGRDLGRNIMRKHNCNMRKEN